MIRRITRPVRAALAGLACAALLAAGSPAAAQEAAAGTDAERRAEAERFFRAGERAFKANQYQDAALLFEQAFAELPLPAIAFSAAQAYRLQYAIDGDPRRLKRAVELYERYTADDPKGKRVGDAARYLADLRPALAALEVQHGAVGALPVERNQTLISVSTTRDVPEARVSIDGGPEELLPVLRAIEPGRHRIRVTAPGYAPVDEAREVIEGQTRLVEVPLAPLPATVQVRSAAGDQVSVDGRPVGTTPLVRPIEIAAGAHLITVTRRGHRPWSREITLARGATTELAPALETTAQRKLSYGVLAASGALVASAGVTYGLSLVAGRDARRLEDRRLEQGLTREEFEAYQQAADRRDDRLGATWVLLGVGGAVGITGALLYFMDSPSPEAPPAAPRITVSPLAGAGPVGLALGGRF